MNHHSIWKDLRAKLIYTMNLVYIMYHETTIKFHASGPLTTNVFHGL